MAEYSQKWHNGTSIGRSTETSDGLAAIQAQLNNLGREIKKKLTTRNLVDLFKEEDIEQQLQDAAIRNQGASIKTLEIQIGQISKLISTTIEADSYPIRRIGSPQYAVSTRQNSKLVYKSRQTTVPFPSCLDNHYCEEEEEGIYGPKFTEDYGASHINNVCFDNVFVDLGASVSVMPLLTYLNLGLGELAHTRLTVELAVRTVKYPKGIAKNVLVEIGKFTFPIDFIILDMSEDIKVPLILERPFLSTARSKINVYKRKITLRVGEEKIILKSVKPASSLIKRVYMLNYIELNDLNEPNKLRRNQGDDLMPTIEEGEVIEEFRTRDEELDTGIDDYPSYCDDDKKIHIDYKMVYKGDNVVGAVMNVPIFVGTFSVVTDFAVLENMDAYHDEGMGDVI
ncbi:putative reverse transcriptase domain-containing protein, partial [Tanacetum coccineum]